MDRAEHRRRAARDQCARAEAALGEGHSDEARRLFEAASRKDATSFDARFGLARALLALGDGGGADRALRQAAAIDPERHEPWLERARIGIDALVALKGPGFWDDGLVDGEDCEWAEPWEIEGWLDRAVELAPRDGGARLLRGRWRASQYDQDGGIADLRVAIEMSPDDPAPWRALARAEAGYWEYVDALESFARLEMLDALTAEDLCVRAEAHRRLGNLAGAENDLRAACALAPDAVEHHAALGALLRDAGRADNAVAPLGRAAELEPDNAERHHALGLTLDAARRNAEAERALDRAVALAPLDARIRYHRGNARRHQKRWADARDDFTRALELDPDCAFAWNNRGAMNKHLGEIDAAVSDYLRAVKVRPQLITAHGNLAGIFRDRKDWPRVLEHAGAVLDRDPDHCDARLHRGWARLRTGDVEGALADFERAVEIDPERAAALNARGVAYGTLGHHDLQIEDTRHALRLSPDDAGIAHNLAVRLLERGRAALEGGDETGRETLTEALALFGRLVRERPDRADERGCLGEAKRAAGRPGEGLADLRRAAAMDPDDAEIHASIARACEDLGESDGAAAAMRRALELDPDQPTARAWLDGRTGWNGIGTKDGADHRG